MLGRHETPSAEDRAALDRGIELFNDGHYHEALDSFEIPYHATPRDEGQLYLGLVRASAALYHFAGGRWRSARRLYVSSIEALRSVAGSPEQSVDVMEFMNGLDRCFAPLMAAAEDTIDAVRPLDPPQIRRVDRA